MTTKCALCYKYLGNCAVVWAAKGNLYCSRTCGICSYFDLTVEEAIKKFDEEAEEINTCDIGISFTTCEWCREEFDASELYSTDLGILCNTCIKAVRSRGEEVRVFS